MGEIGVGCFKLVYDMPEVLVIIHLQYYQFKHFCMNPF